ncbi:hypothetical protein SHIRM173S_11140 [Streptomyces hirsutus]
MSPEIVCSWLANSWAWARSSSEELRQETDLPFQPGEFGAGPQGGDRAEGAPVLGDGHPVHHQHPAVPDDDLVASPARLVRRPVTRSGPRPVTLPVLRPVTALLPRPVDPVRWPAPRFVLRPGEHVPQPPVDAEGVQRLGRRLPETG